MNPIVKVVLVLVRGREMLLVASDALAVEVEGMEPVYSLPAAELRAGEPFAECAARIGRDAGVLEFAGLELRRLANVSTATGGHKVELSFLAEVPPDQELPAGSAFFAIDGLPETIDEAARATIAGFSEGTFAVDLGGERLAASVAVPAPQPSAAPSPPAEILVSLPPPLPIPPMRPTGFWFAGALIWATALALAVAHGREVPGDVVLVAWGTVVVPVWLFIGRWGLPRARDEDPLPWGRLFATLAFGFGTLLFAGLILGIVGSDMRPREAYYCFVLIGMGTLAAGRYRARRGLSVPAYAGGAKAVRVLGWVFVVVVTTLIIAGVPM